MDIARNVAAVRPVPKTQSRIADPEVSVDRDGVRVKRQGGQESGKPQHAFQQEKAKTQGEAAEKEAFHE